MKKYRVAFTLAEVFHPVGQSKRIASRIIRVVAGVTSRSNSRAGALRATAPYRKFGFTLAEVLITLGIIGVVAALTMPTLINNIQDKDLESRYNKAKNMLANGYKLMMAKEDMDSPNDLFLSACNDWACISKYHNSYFKILKDTTNGLSLDNLSEEYSIKNEDFNSKFKWSDVEYAFVTNDGFIYGLIPFDDDLTFSIVTDVNNKNKPNTVKRDLYKFRFDNRGVLVDVTDEFGGGECSLQHPEGCMTEEECYSIKGKHADDYSWCERTYWENGRCHFFRGRCPA